MMNSSGNSGNTDTSGTATGTTDPSTQGQTGAASTGGGQYDSVNNSQSIMDACSSVAWLLMFLPITEVNAELSKEGVPQGADATVDKTIDSEIGKFK